MCNVLEVWKKKYGEQEALRKWDERINKQRETNKRKMSSMTKEDRSKKYGNVGIKNPMYNKTFYDIWLTKYGKDEADKLLVEWNNKNNEFNSIRSANMKGNNNPSKKPDASLRISTHRKKYYEIKENRIRSSEITIKLHQEGRLKSGYTKNYKYLTSNGREYIVQGSYELAFIKWLDTNNLTFRCHEDRIQYTSADGTIHYYLPDFYVDSWNSYVDVKSSYWYNQQKQKFEDIFKSNKNLNLKILLETHLRELNII